MQSTENSSQSNFVDTPKWCSHYATRPTVSANKGVWHAENQLQMAQMVFIQRTQSNLLTPYKKAEEKHSEKKTET